MEKINGFLFIDSNKYLDLYRTENGKKLLKPLTEQANHIFVTKQIVDEVMRNKVNVVSKFLYQKINSLTFKGLSLPNHFLNGSVDNSEYIRDKLRSINSEVNELKLHVNTNFQNIIKQVAESEDETSKALIKVFKNYKEPSNDEISKARSRKEIGNPPGKAKDPLGDQLSWEQLINQNIKNKTIWIITRDDDYGIEFNKDVYLNSFLIDELKSKGVTKVYAFKNLVSGLTHFIDEMKIKVKENINEEDLIKIEKEENSLPQVSSSNFWDMPTLYEELVNIEAFRKDMERLTSFTQFESELSNLSRLGKEYEEMLNNIVNTSASNFGLLNKDDIDPSG